MQHQRRLPKGKQVIGSCTVHVRQCWLWVVWVSAVYCVLVFWCIHFHAFSAE
jgi:hypothetical protein